MSKNNATVAAPGTIAYEALQFLREHADSTQALLAAGIGRNAKQLGQQLSDALLAGVLARIEGVNGGWVWNVGPNADVAQSTEPGEDVRKVVKVSALAAPSIFAYADQRRAAPFSTSLSTDGRLSIERYGRVICELTNAERCQLVKTAAEGVVA